VFVDGSVVGVVVGVVYVWVPASLLVVGLKALLLTFVEIIVEGMLHGVDLTVDSSPCGCYRPSHKDKKESLYSIIKRMLIRLITACLINFKFSLVLLVITWLRIVRYARADRQIHITIIYYSNIRYMLCTKYFLIWVTPYYPLVRLISYDIRSRCMGSHQTLIIVEFSNQARKPWKVCALIEKTITRFLAIKRSPIVIWFLLTIPAGNFSYFFVL
jgi:hypothetical protein